MLYGDTRFGDRQTVRTLVGSIIPFTGTAVITGDGGITIERAHTTRHQLVDRVELQTSDGIVTARERGALSHHLRRRQSSPSADRRSDDVTEDRGRNWRSRHRRA